MVSSGPSPYDNNGAEFVPGSTGAVYRQPPTPELVRFTPKDARRARAATRLSPADQETERKAYKEIVEHFSTSGQTLYHGRLLPPIIAWRLCDFLRESGWEVEVRERNNCSFSLAVSTPIPRKRFPRKDR